MKYSPIFTRLAVVPMLAMTVASCDKMSVAKRTDSLTTALSEQTLLGNQLQVQKDSLTRIVLDADAFLGQMDSAVRTVRGLPRTKRAATESPLADQVVARRDMMERVQALVARAKSTAAQLSELQKKEIALQTENAQLREAAQAQANKVAEDAQMVADLGATIERQRLQIASLEARIDSLGTEMGTLGTRHFKAYYVVGTEKELIEKGVIVKEGGANLLFVRAGRTLQPARVLNADLFTAIDQRETRTIPMPDSTKTYRVISRQSLDDAEVAAREGTAFKGNLNITKPDEFWAPSRFLILVRS
jgi:hypothetical protein